MTTDGLTGRRVLLVEDEYLVAKEIETTLRKLGCVVLGPVATLDAALRLARDEMLDAAILDVTIRGGSVYPVAERLIARGIPFLLASGYSDWALPESMQNLPRLTKPFTAQQLEGQVRSLVSAMVVRTPASPA